jgi:invasion protein IalB
MRHLLRPALALVVVAAAGAGAAAAQTPTPRFVANHRDWTVYEVAETSGKICYIASEPKNQEGNYARRGSPAVLVARLPGRAASEQVSVQPGYTYKKDSAVEVKIDGQTFQLFTQGEHAWARTDADDRALIGAMRAGATMSVRGTSTRDTFSLDTYSLAGFTAAFEAMRDACTG